MNIEDFRKELADMSKAIGTKADVFCSIESRECDKPIRISVYREGICSDMTFMSEGADLQEALDAVKARWFEVSDRVEAATIQGMALEIIRITDELGECTDAALRGGKYSAADVTRFGERACAKANDMAAGGPFSIQADGKANAA